MSSFEISITDEELTDEVRNSLAGIDDSKIPDETIIQTAERFVVPLLNDVIPQDLEPSDAEDQNDFDSAAIAWVAEMSFGAWLTFTRLRDREVETFIDPKQYQKQLEKKTNYALQLVDATRPSDIPKTVVTVKHDGVNRTVDLNKIWVRE